MSVYQYLLVNCRPLSVSCFLFLPPCLFLQHNYSVLLSQRSYHLCDYNTVAMATVFFFPPHETVVQCWQLAFRLDPPLVNLNLVRKGRAGTCSCRDRTRSRNAVLLTGRRVSTLPFLQCDVIDGDVSLNAWSPDTFQYHLDRTNQVCVYIYTKRRTFAILQVKI